MPRNVEKIAEMYSKDGIIPSVELANNALHLAGYEAKEFAMKEDLKKIKEEVPTKTSQLENDSGFITEHQDISSLATKEELNQKVDKVNGKSLIDDTELERLSNIKNYDDTSIKEELKNKVDVISGKGLSSNDYTDSEKSKLKQIEAGAQVNKVNSVNGKIGTVNLNANDVEAIAEPTNEGTSGQVLTTDGNGGRTWATVSGGGSGAVSSVNGKTGAVVLTATDIGAVPSENGKGLSTNDFTTTEKNKLSGIESGANNYVLPNDVVRDSDYIHTDNNFTTLLKTKLSNAVVNHLYTKVQVAYKWVGTQEEYDAITEKESNVEYNIIEE